MILDLLILTAIVSLIYNSGFFEVMDEIINKKYKPYHLPHIFHCAYCGVWWITIFFVLFTGNLTLINILFCLLCAGLSDIIIALYTTILEGLKKIIFLINKLIW